MCLDDCLRQLLRQVLTSHKLLGPEGVATLTTCPALSSRGSHWPFPLTVMMLQSCAASLAIRGMAELRLGMAQEAARCGCQASNVLAQKQRCWSAATIHQQVGATCLKLCLWTARIETVSAAVCFI